MISQADVVICGAGILGISAAYHLAVVNRQPNIVLIDERPPLTLTSDKSTEAYRNWWPGPGDAMVRLMNRSIDLMEAMARQSNNVFKLNRRGYLYVTTDPSSLNSLRTSANEASVLGAGELRENPGMDSYIPHEAEGFDSRDGADLITGRAVISKHFPYLSQETAAILHVRRAGWLSGQIYGMWMLELAKAAGVRTITGHVSEIEIAAGRVSGVILQDGSKISTGVFVNAAGPYLERIGDLLGVEIPVINELHLKASFNDSLQALDRIAPLVICAEAQTIEWTAQERAMLADDPETSWLLETLPSGAHTRPEGDQQAQTILVLWDIHNQPVDPVFPIPDDPLYAELAVRGLVRILPGFRGYVERMPKPLVDGGYYTKTQENRPLAGPLPLEGAFVIGAASGYGIMAAAGLGELLAASVVGAQLPEYAPMFAISRYQDGVYKSLLKNWGDSWQL